VIEIHEVRPAGQLRIGGARVAAELEIRGTRRFADDEEQHERFVVDAGDALHIASRIDQRRVRITLLLCGQQARQAHDRCSRTERAHRLVLAEEDRGGRARE
jgi:hypothetical protein